MNASRELQAQSKPSRFNRDSDFAAPPVLVYRPKGSVGEGSVSFAGQLPQVHRKAVGKMRGGMTPGSFKIPHLLSEPRYEIMLTDLNRKVGIFEKRGKFSALSDGSNLEQGFRSLHLSNLCFHAGPLIRQEKIFAVMDWEFRSRIFSMMMAFARKVDFKYHCLTVDKKFITSAEMLVQKLRDGLDEFLTSQRSEMSLYDKVKIYYDCGQSPLTNLLHRAFEGKYGPRIEFAQAVKPERYRLFQLADLVCSLKLIELRLASGGTMTESEYTFFGGPKAFKHNILRRIKRKEI